MALVLCVCVDCVICIFYLRMHACFGRVIQGANNSGKPGNLREFVNSGKLWENSEFKIY